MPALISFGESTEVQDIRKKIGLFGLKSILFFRVEIERAVAMGAEYLVADPGRYKRGDSGKSLPDAPSLPLAFLLNFNHHR